MNAPTPTPGQLNYEAHQAARWPDGTGTPIAWTHPAVAKARPAWEAGAVAGAAGITAELARVRELLDEIGVMAANAPEDGDSFGLLEQIAMRIAEADVPS